MYIVLKGYLLSRTSDEFAAADRHRNKVHRLIGGLVIWQVLNPLDRKSVV